LPGLFSPSQRIQRDTERRARREKGLMIAIELSNGVSIEVANARAGSRPAHTKPPKPSRFGRNGIPPEIVSNDHASFHHAMSAR
jgi:hypothetical protein